MRQINVTIPDDFYDAFISYCKDIPNASIDENTNDEVPLWQQEMVLERIRNAKAEDYVSWEESKKKLDAKWFK